MTFDFRRSLTHYSQGLLMGGADIIPGVSGGTMALIVGIYARLIDSISSLFSAVANAARLNKGKAIRHWHEVEWGLVVPLALGIGSAIVVAAQFIPHLLDAYPHQMRGLFLGLVAASIAVPWLRIGRFTPTLFALALAAAALAFFLVSLPVLAVDETPGLLRVFASASVAICAMILPGVSGAFLLEVLGIYEPTTAALGAVFDLEGAAVLYVLVFMGGAAVGLGLFSQLLDWLIENHHDPTMAALVGLMAGSLRALWPYQDWATGGRDLEWPSPTDPVTSVVLLALLGFGFVAALTWYGSRRIAAEAES